MSLSLNDNLKVNSPKLIEDRSGKFVSGVWTPYASATEANSLIPSPYRALGLTVHVLENGNLVEYWYKTDITDNGLVLKQNDLIDPFVLTAAGTRVVPAPQTLILIELKANIGMTINIGTASSPTHSDIQDGLVLLANETKYVEYIKKADTNFTIYIDNVTTGGTLNAKLIKKLY